MLTFQALSVRHTYFHFIAFTSNEIYSIDTYARCLFFFLLIFLPPQNKCICFANKHTYHCRKSFNYSANAPRTCSKHSIYSVHSDNPVLLLWIKHLHKSNIVWKTHYPTRLLTLVLLDMRVFYAHSKVFPLLTLIQFGFDFTKFAIFAFHWEKEEKNELNVEYLFIVGVVCRV